MSGHLDKAGVKPGRRVRDLRRALKGTVALCASCHRSLGGLAVLPFRTRAGECEGFTVQARRRAPPCTCKKCLKKK